MGAPLGNQNARKGRWGEALARAAEIEDQVTRRRRMDAIAEKLIEKALDGDIGAIKEFGDRIDGKAHQTVSGPDGDAIPVRGTIELVRPT